MSDTAMCDGASTVADYETFVEARRDDERFELIRGRVVTMTNPSEDHGQPFRPAQVGHGWGRMPGP